MHVEEYRIIPGDLPEFERLIMPFRGGMVVECTVVEDEIISAPRAIGWCDGYFVDVINGGQYIGERVKVRLSNAARSHGLGEVLGTSKMLDKSEPI